MSGTISVTHNTMIRKKASLGSKGFNKKETKSRPLSFLFVVFHTPDNAHDTRKGEKEVWKYKKNFLIATSIISSISDKQGLR